jgi:hypothetical protein
MVLGFFGEPYGQKNCQMCDYCLNPTGANGTPGPQAGSSGLVDMSDDAALLMNAVKFCGVSRDFHKAVFWRGVFSWALSVRRCLTANSRC